MTSVVDNLIHQGVIHSPLVIRAFRTIHRKDFLPKHLGASAEVDAPIPIGLGQTNSQPFTVATMLELLDLQPGQRILDVGAGSGWTAALLASIVGPSGRVIAIERVHELWKQGRDHAAAYHFAQLSFVYADGTAGWPPAAPYDRIHVAAAADQIPRALLDQLAAPGILVMPVGDPTLGSAQDLVRVAKRANDTLTESRIPGFAFVPLVAGEVSTRYTGHP